MIARLDDIKSGQLWQVSRTMSRTGSGDILTGFYLIVSFQNYDKYNGYFLCIDENGREEKIEPYFLFSNCELVHLP